MRCSETDEKEVYSCTKPMHSSLLIVRNIEDSLFSKRSLINWLAATIFEL